MRRARSRTLALLAAMTTLTACVTTQPQPDGSTKVNVSFGGMTGTSPNSAPAAAPAPAPAPASTPAGRPAAVMSQARQAANPSASAVAGKGRAPVDLKARAQLEQALACKALPSSFNRAESMLKQAGWSSDQGITPVTLGAPIKVYGLSVSKIAVSRDGGEQTYRSHLPGTSLQQIAKAASLKLGKDRTYSRMTKLGVLSASMEDGEATLTCTVNTEG
jgi:hypothetical protein